MRWDSGRESGNVEDRRGMSLGGGVAGGGIGVVLIAIVAWFFGIDPSTVFNLLGSGTPTEQSTPAPAPPKDDPMARFVSVVLADTEDTWTALFAARGQRYEDPKLVLFSGAINSACGSAQAAMGPFYCAADHKIYIDLSFYDDLRTRFHAPGEFAEAYVVAHEVGHHVQNLLGIFDQAATARQRMSTAQANQISVRLELQADCFAGIWGFHANRTRHILETGDIEAALTAASAIGDDRLQKQSRGYVTPESFTHGSSEQRVRWFKRGIESGRLEDCDTFHAASL